MLRPAPQPVLEVDLGNGKAYVRELSGVDERAVAGGGTALALSLLDDLLVGVPGARIGPGEAAQLTASERDRLLAAIHIHAFGPKVSATAPCGTCGEPFDLDFDLRTLSAAVFGAPSAREVRLPSGARYRVPTGADEAAVANLPAAEVPAALRARCLVSGPDGDSEAAVAAAFEAGAPLLDLELGAPCPNCGAANEVQFSMQRWLFAALERERPRLRDELHVLARAYGWGLGELLSMTRAERRAFVALLERDAASRSPR